MMADEKRAAGGGDRRGALRCARALVALAASALWPSGAWAEDPPPASDAAKVAQCISAHTSVQELRKKHLLLQAREALKGCLQTQCPAPVQSECYAWTEEIDKETPSVIFNVTSKTVQVVDMRVIVDGAPVELSTTGSPLRLDPGHHTYRVMHAGYQPATREIVLFAGQRFLQLNVELEPLADAKAKRAPPSPVMETYRPVPAVTYVFLAVGLAGAASFAGWGLAGLSAQHDLESSCSPRCTDSRISSSGVRTRYLAADISMGIGGAGVVAFGLSLLLRPVKERPVTVSVVPGPTGVWGGVVFRGM